MGSVVSVQPHLDRVDVKCEINDENTPIPTNSDVFANQSGLISEPLVDIMPKYPIPNTFVSPLSEQCAAEGAIVCNEGTITGKKGVALDDLVYTCTQLMRQIDSGGMDQIITAADTVSQAVKDAQPLVDATTGLIEQARFIAVQ